MICLILQILIFTGYESTFLFSYFHFFDSFPVSYMVSSLLTSFQLLQVGRAGRFGTKGLAITFVSSASDSDILNQVITPIHIHYLNVLIFWSLFCQSGSFGCYAYAGSSKV